MPDIRYCRKCKKIFNYIGGAMVCATCRDKQEQDFRRVKQYLYDNPGATMSEVSTVLEISVEEIKDFLREGRLEIMNSEGNMVLECEKCGKAIKSGRYCDECVNNLTSDLKSTASEMTSEIAKAQSSPKGIGMRYLNKDKK